jgi:hypothetical protein
MPSGKGRMNPGGVSCVLPPRASLALPSFSPVLKGELEEVAMASRVVGGARLASTGAAYSPLGSPGTPWMNGDIPKEPVANSQ